MKSVAVIGAGITGMTTAFLLKRNRCPVEVYEASDRIGGAIRSVQQDGYLVEAGPNTLLNTDGKIEDIIRMAELTGHVCFTSKVGGSRFLVRGGRVREMPSSPVAFFTSSLFSWFAKMNLMLEPFRPRWKNRYEETLAQFVKRRFGQEFLTYAIDALVAGIYAGNPERLSVMHGFPRLYNAEQKYGSLIKAQYMGARERKKNGRTSKQDARTLSFDGGLQVLIDGLKCNLGNSIHLNCPVKKITQTGAFWKVSWMEDGSLMEKEHSAVLICVPAHAIEEIKLESKSGYTFSRLSEIPYAPVTSVALGYEQKDVGGNLNGFGFLVPGIEKLNILGTLYSSSLFPNRAPKGHVLLTSYVGGMRQPELTGLPQDKLFDMVHENLASLLKITGKPTFRMAFHHTYAIPQYNIGYGVYKDLIAQIQETCPGLYIGGNYTKSPALSDNIVAGFGFAAKMQARAKSSEMTSW